MLLFLAAESLVSLVWHFCPTCLRFQTQTGCVSILFFTPRHVENVQQGKLQPGEDCLKTSLTFRCVSQGWRSELMLDSEQTQFTPSHRIHQRQSWIQTSYLKRRTGPLLSGSKSCFQMKVKFLFHSEMKVPAFGGRMKRTRNQVD